MRWNSHITGDKRIRKGFLFFPKGSVQKRWLEYAEWEDEYITGIGWTFLRWKIY